MTATSLKRNSKDKFESLPEDFKQAIEESLYDETLINISKKHKLHIDQSANLEILLAKIVFDEIRPEEIIQKIENEVQISKTEALDLAKDIDEEIIKPIKVNLMKIQTGE